jgi:hypothetical protein
MSTQTQNKRIQTSMPWGGSEPTIPVFERVKTVHGLGSAVTVIGNLILTNINKGYNKWTEVVETGRIHTMYAIQFNVSESIEADYARYNFRINPNNVTKCCRSPRKRIADLVLYYLRHHQISIHEGFCFRKWRKATPTSRKKKVQLASSAVFYLQFLTLFLD